MVFPDYFYAQMTLNDVQEAFATRGRHWTAFKLQLLALMKLQEREKEKEKKKSMLTAFQN